VGRLSWLVPYVVGATGLLAAVFAAVRWSRRTSIADGATGSPEAAEDAALRSRLDDELRDLD
jgi:hypothetical protein